ncbi:MAG TPA: hypothetical protein ENH82_02650 [bacterium]|nr:hypothetical protein [bacterium]
MKNMSYTGKTSRRKLLSLSAMAGMTGLAGLSALQPNSAIGKESSNPDSKGNALIDAHSHMLSGLYRFEKRKKRFNNLKEINLQDLFDQMDTMGIEKFVTVSQGGSNELSIDLQKAFPDRCIGIFGAIPIDNRNVFNRQMLKEFKAAARDHGINVMFLGPPYNRFFANDRRVYPFYEAAVEYDALVFFHYGGGVGGGGGKASSAPMKYAQPVLLDDVVIDFPELRINVEHMAFPRTEELLALMKHAPNVYTDVCELFTRPTVLAWYLLMAKEYGVIDRIIWGSDYDIYWYDDFDFSRYFKKVKEETSWIKYDLNKILQKSGWPTLTQEEINGILYTNAKKMLKL